MNKLLKPATSPKSRISYFLNKAPRVVPLAFKLIPFLVLFVMVCLFFLRQIGWANDYGDQNKHKKHSNRFFFIEDAYERRDTKEFVDIVWKTYVTRILKSKEIEVFNITKENIVLILIDLNKDETPDILASVVNNDYFCGKFGQDCALVAFVSSKTLGYTEIESCASVFWEGFPVYALDSATNGLRDIIVNDKTLLKFNGKKYCYEN